jgi:lysophospholipase L1-like esterase
MGGASTTFNPCPALPEPCKLMSSGDSITVGAQSTDTGGYRAPLFGTTLQNKKAITFVGPSGAGPATVDGVAFPDAHDGHSGYIIDTVGSRKGLLPLMAQNLTKYTPHIVLLMIGTNDVNSQVELSRAPTRMANLIDLITETAPSTLLVVAQLIPTRTDSLNSDVQTLNASIKTLVSDRAKAGKHVLLVDMYSAFTANANYKTEWLFDGLHPTDAGYAVMAKVWYPAISGLLH